MFWLALSLKFSKFCTQLFSEVRIKLTLHITLFWSLWRKWVASENKKEKYYQNMAINQIQDKMIILSYDLYVLKTLPLGSLVTNQNHQWLTFQIILYFTLNILLTNLCHTANILSNHSSHVILLDCMIKISNYTYSNLLLLY